MAVSPTLLRYKNTKPTPMLAEGLASSSMLYRRLTVSAIPQPKRAPNTLRPAAPVREVFITTIERKAAILSEARNPSPDGSIKTTGLLAEYT